MRKLVYILLCICLCTTLIGCRNDKKDNTDIETINFINTDVVADYDSSLSVETGEFSYSLLKRENNTYDDSFVIGMISLSSIGIELENSVDFLHNPLQSDILKYAKGKYHGNDIVVEGSKIININSFDYLQFSGTIYNGEYNCSVYGYNFIIDDNLCSVIGVVATEDQGQELIDEVNQYVEDITYSIRIRK